MLRTKEKQALDLDLDLTPRGQNPEKEARLSARPLPPGREERGTDGARGDRGGARRERGTSGQARAGDSPRPGPQAGRQSPTRAALAGTGGTCYPCGGRYPASATGARGGPDPAGPQWGPAGERVARPPEGAGQALESARNPMRGEAPTHPAATWTGAAGEPHPWTGRRPARDAPQTAAARTRRHARPVWAYSTKGTVFRHPGG